MKLKVSIPVIFLCAFLVPLALLATDPPPIPDHLMPPAIWPKAVQRRVVAPRAVPNPGPPLTLEKLNHLPVSGVLYDVLYRGLKAKEKGAGKEVVSSKSTEELSVISAASTVTATARATNDTRQDVEPAVTAVNVSGTTYTAAMSIKYIPVTGLAGNNPRIYYSTTSDFASFVSGQLPMPTGYAMSGDPLMSTNPYTGGIAPKRVYCVGLLFNLDPPNSPGSTPSAIGVWRSDDGGRTWSYPSIVASQAGGGYAVDKPAIAVSWNVGSLGYVYVTWVSIDFNNVAGSSIWVARSTDGGLTFPTSTVITYDNVTGPQVTVNANNGDVHVVWVNWAHNDLRFSMSTNLGVSFGPHEVISGGNLFQGNLNGNVRAWTMPMARFNWVANRLGVVWHAIGANGMDVYYSYRPCSSACNFWGWEQPQMVNDDTTGDQFMPALDFNSAGNVMIPFYDRRDDPSSNLLYHHYVAEVGPNGNSLDINRRVSTFQSNPTVHTTGTGFAGFIGDYHDAWSFTYPEGERTTSVWIGIPGTTPGEAYLSKIAY